MSISGEGWTTDMGMFGGATKFGDPADVKNINPMTQGAWDQSQNVYNQSQSFLSGYNYLQPFQQFLSQLAPGLSNLATNDQYSSAQRSLAQSSADQIRRDLMNQFSSGDAGGSLFSGAFAKALGGGVGNALLGAEANIAGSQNQLRSSLLGGALGQLGGMYQLPYQLQAQFGQQALGNMGQLGAPEWWQPTYQANEGIFGMLMKGLTGAAATKALFTD